jgi:hypothetical protein
MRRATRFGLISITMTGIALLAAPEAKSQTSEVMDDELDAFFLFNFGIEPQRAPDYLDLTSGEIKLDSGHFLFHLTVADDVPKPPFVARAQGENGVIDWHWVIDIDPNTSLAGFPAPPGIPLPGEFLVHIFWDGSTEPNAIFIDRWPILLGGKPTVRSLEPSIIENELSVAVPSGWLGYPQSFDSFTWFGVADVFPGGYGSWSFTPTDLTPVATWTSE